MECAPEFLEYSREFLSVAESGLKAGRSVDEVAAPYKPSPKFKGYGQDAARIKGNIEVIAAELKREAATIFLDGHARREGAHRTGG